MSVEVSAVDQRLDDLAARIERAAVDPRSVTAPWTLRLVRPLLALVGWQPSYVTERAKKLLLQLRNASSGPDDDELSISLQAAIDELEHNVQLAERACVVNGSLPVRHASWLARLERTLRRVERTCLLPDDDAATRVARAFDPIELAPPLTLAAAEQQAAVAVQDEPETAPSVPRSRLLELQLAAIDHVLDAARSESSFVVHRRRLLEAARRLLLDASAALPLDRQAVEERQRYIGEQIVQLDRLQAAGVSSDVALLHQARSAASRGQRQRLYASLVALDGFALAAGDVAVARQTGALLAALEAGADTTSDEARRASLERSAEEVLGRDVTDRIRRGYREAHDVVEQRAEHVDPEEAETYRLALEYLAPGGEHATFSALLSADGCFDVGAPLSPVRVQETRTIARVVSHPTQQLLLGKAYEPADLPHAVIEDPRMLLLSLAAGRLLTRKYVAYEEHHFTHTRMVGEVRVYVLDGSTSMLEDGRDMARARMRDAILLAELATLLRRFENPERFTRVRLYYRYFTKRVWPVHKVDSAAVALAAMGEVLEKPMHGGTDIEKALATSFAMIERAKRHDPDLARGQIVLITDGQAEVRDEVVHAARERTAIPIGVSVIALGQENAALRRLVAEQRRHGERAFYHFVDDDTLAELCSGELGSLRAMHLPPGDADPLLIEQQLGGILDELADLDNRRHRALLAAPDDELASAYAELGLEPGSVREGQRAQREASERD